MKNERDIYWDKIENKVFEGNLKGQTAIVTGGGERFSKGDRIYQTTSEPDVDDDWEEFLEGTMDRIEEELEGGRRSRSKLGSAADAEKLVGAD